MSFEHEGLAFNWLDTLGHQDFSEDTYRFRLSTENPCRCHNRMVLPRMSAPTIGPGGSRWRELAIPDLSLIKQAKQAARQEVSWIRRERRWQRGWLPSYPPFA